MAFNPNASQLSQEQILQQVFDQADNALNVNVETPVTISGDVMVEITAVSGDNIAIANQAGTNFLVVNPDGSINTNVTFPSSIGVTQSTSPWVVSGTVTANAGTGTFAVSAASLPLPAGAATSANQTTQITALNSIVTNTSNLPTLGQKTMAGSQPVVIASDQSAIPVSQSGTWNIGTLTSITNPVAVTGTFWQATQPISATSLPLPTGASTSALQTTGNTSLSSIDIKTPALGQALAAASVPVVLTAAQLTTLTPLTSVTVTQATGTNLHTVIDNFPATQPVSGTVTANQGTNPWIVSGAVTTSPNVNIHDGSGNSLTSQVNGSQRALDVGIDVAGVQIDPRQIRTLTSADVITADQGGTWNINNISGTISLPTGAATSALQTTINTTLGSPFQAGGSIGNTSFASTQSGTWNINNISGTVSLPTGASTSALQTAGNTSLTTIATNTAVLATATVLPANTASAATNTSLVVALSPLSSLPTGTNTLGNLNTNNDHQGSGTITTGTGTIIATTNGCSTVVFTVLGTWSAFMFIEGTVDGTNWAALYFDTPGGPSIDIFTANNTYIVPCGGFIQVRLIPFVFTSGTLTATWDASSGVNLAANNALLTSLVNQNNEVAPTSTVTRVASSATNVSLLVANTARQAAYFYNESTSIAYVKLGTTASATSYTLQMAPLSFATIDYDPVYTGEVDAIWVTANGAMQVTELT